MMRAPRAAFGPGFSLAKYVAPVVVQRDRTDAPDGLARARQEHVEDRQGAADLAGLQIGLHLLGDEEAEAQDRAQRTLDVVERRRDAAARQSRQIRHRAHRLQRAQHIGRGLRIERVRVEKIRAAEHVEHGRPRRGEIGVRPGADLRQLALLELRKRAIEEFGVALPGADPWSAASTASRRTASCRPGNFAVSSAVAVSARAGSMAANSMTAASVAMRMECSMFIRDPTDAATGS